MIVSSSRVIFISLALTSPCNCLLISVADPYSLLYPSSEGGWGTSCKDCGVGISESNVPLTHGPTL